MVPGKEKKRMQLKQLLKKNRYNLTFTPQHQYIHTLQTVLFTFTKGLTRRICLTVKSFFPLVIISFIIVTLMCDSVVIL